MVCLGVKHAQVALESAEECVHSNQFSLKVICRFLAHQSTLSIGDPVKALTATEQNPAELPGLLVTEPEAGTS